MMVGGGSTCCCRGQVDDSDVADQVKRERDEMLFYNLYYRRFSGEDAVEAVGTI